jgi:hypothetical protein
MPVGKHSIMPCRRSAPISAIAHNARLNIRLPPIPILSERLNDA